MMNHWIWGFQLYEKSEGKTVLRAHLETSQWFWHSLWHRSQNTNSERNTAWSLQFLWRMDSSPRWGLVLRFYCYMSHQALHWSKSGLSLKFFMRESGWWFGTCFIFPFTWECHHPNWRTPSFFRGEGWNHQPVGIIFPIDELHHFSRWLKPPPTSYQNGDYHGL